MTEVRRHDEMLDCLGYVLEALMVAADERRSREDWVEFERKAVAIAANEWAGVHDYLIRTTVQDVERLEIHAVGHVDYMRKLSLYVAERIVYGQSVGPR